MELIDELENDIVSAILVDRKYNRELKSDEVVSLLRNVKDSLRKIESHDHISPQFVIKPPIV